MKVTLLILILTWCFCTGLKAQVKRDFFKKTSYLYNNYAVYDSAMKYYNLSELYHGHNDSLHALYSHTSAIYFDRLDSLYQISENKAWVHLRDSLAKKYNMKLP